MDMPIMPYRALYRMQAILAKRKIVLCASYVRLFHRDAQKTLPISVSFFQGKTRTQKRPDWFFQRKRCKESELPTS